MRTAAGLAFVAMVALASAAGAELPFDLDSASSIESARTRLLNLRNAGQISHDEMMNLARQLEPKLRGARMDEWRVRNAGNDLLGIERGGSSPSAGRGIFGDEDLQTKNHHQYDELLEKARQRGYTIVQDPETPYRFKIAELDTVVWKPTGDTFDQIVQSAARDPNAVIRVPKGVDVPGVALGPFRQLPPDLDAQTRLRILQDLADRGEIFDVTLGDRTISPTRPPPAEEIALRRDQALRHAHDPEVAFTGRPGTRLRPSDGLETSLENTTKGRHGLFEPVSKVPTPGQELALIGTAKDVWRSMQATGLCERENLALCEKLDRVRRMQAPLSELGLGDAQQIQARLQDLQGQAILRGRQIFSNEIDQLARLLADPERASDPLLAQRLRALEAQADRMAVRFQEIAGAHPDFVKRLGLGAEDFWSEQMRGVKKLRAQHARTTQDAAENAAGFRSATVVVNTLQLAECLQRETPEATGSYDEDVVARSSALTSCLVEFASGEMIGEIGSRLMLRFTSPTGVLVARGVAHFASGVGVVMSLIEIGKGGWEAIRLAGAWREEWLAEERAEEMAQRLADRRHEETAHFATDLDALAGDVERTRAELENERDGQKSELTALSARIEKLLQVREHDRALRALLQEVETRAGCSRSSSGSETARELGATQGAASSGVLADRVEQQLRSGLAAATSCKSPEDLARGRAALHQAEQTLARLELAPGGLRSALEAGDPKPATRDDLERLRAEEAVVANTLREAAEASERFRTVREEAEASRESAKERSRALRERYDRFVFRFSQDLLAMEREQGDRVGALARAIDTIPEIPLGGAFVADLDRRRFELEMSVIPQVRDQRLDVERGLAALARCLDGKGGETPDDADTALTVGRLADATLGRDLRGRLEACAARIGANPAQTGRSSGDAGNRPDPAVLARDLAECEKALACFEEGSRKYPRASLDCNGNYTMRTRSTEIEETRKRCASLRARAGLPAATARAPELRTFDADALTRDIARWERQIACLERAKSDPNEWTGDCNTFLMGTPDEQIAILRRQIADARERLGEPVAQAPDRPSGEESVVAEDPEDQNPWERADVQRMTDEWLSQAVAGLTREGREVRYNEWAQPLAPGARSTGAPERPAGWSRHRYLWETRARWTSTNLCSLGDYLERRMNGEGAESCTASAQAATEPQSQSEPPPAASPQSGRGWQAPMPVAGETTRAEVSPAGAGRGWSAPMEVTGGAIRRSESPTAHPGARASAAPSQNRASAPPAAPAPAPRQRAASDPFIGSWTCAVDVQDDDFLSNTATERMLLTIARSGSGYAAEANGDRLFGEQVAPGRLRFEGGGRQSGHTYASGLDLQVAGGGLAGGGRIVVNDPDGGADSIPYRLTCRR